MNYIGKLATVGLLSLASCNSNLFCIDKRNFAPANGYDVFLEGKHNEQGGIYAAVLTVGKRKEHGGYEEFVLFKDFTPVDGRLETVEFRAPIGSQLEQFTSIQEGNRIMDEMLKFLPTKK